MESTDIIVTLRAAILLVAITGCCCKLKADITTSSSRGGGYFGSDGGGFWGEWWREGRGPSMRFAISVDVWSNYGAQRVISSDWLALGHDLIFVAEFGNLEDRNVGLEGGSWTVLWHCLTARLWVPSFIHSPSIQRKKRNSMTHVGCQLLQQFAGSSLLVISFIFNSLVNVSWPYGRESCWWYFKTHHTLVVYMQVCLNSDLPGHGSDGSFHTWSH